MKFKNEIDKKFIEIYSKNTNIFITFIQKRKFVELINNLREG